MADRRESWPAGTLLAGVELGATQCVCVLGTSPYDIRAEEHLPTGEREWTLSRIEAILTRWHAQYRFGALGIASFGPLDLTPRSSTYGHILGTARPGWGNTAVVSRFNALGVSVGFDTDVNGAALAESHWGKAIGLDHFAYVTVGTGVDVGVIVNGRTLLGCSHPDLGHIRIARMPGDAWPGACRFHGDCVEGLASGPAIQARVGMPAECVAAEHHVWQSVAHALGQLLHTLVLATGPRRIIVGGGVIGHRPELLARVRDELARSLNGYVQVRELARDIDSYVIPTALGERAGRMGALALAAEAANL
jgi:fructokinase